MFAKNLKENNVRKSEHSCNYVFTSAPVESVQDKKPTNLSLDVTPLFLATKILNKEIVES